MTTATSASPVFDRTEGARVLRFGQKYIVQTKGKWAGKPLAHEPWEKALFGELFLRKPNGQRVYDQALIGVARKNGKSTIGAELALYGLVGTGEHSPEVYAAAASREQAGIVFRQSLDFVTASPRLLDYLQPQRSIIHCKSNRGMYRVLSSDAPLQYGLNPNMVVIDELWAHANPELFYALTTADLARDNPLTISITTAGYDRKSICFDRYQYGLDLRENGGIEAMRKAGFLFWWYEVPADADYRDETQWHLANPSSWITVERLQRYAERFPESVFRRLHLNQWTETEEAWVKPWEWDACKGEVKFDPKEATWMAVDVGIRRDSSAIIWGQFHGPNLHIGHRILTPEEERSFGVADAREAVAAEAMRMQRLEEVNYDPWSFVESAEILQDRGLPMVEYPQTAARMAPASEALYELITERRLVHDGDRTLREHVLNAVVAGTERGGWRISKRKSEERIDACVSLAMVADRAVTMHLVKPQGKRVFLD